MDTSVWCLMEAVSGQTGLTMYSTHDSILPGKKNTIRIIGKQAKRASIYK